MQVNVEQLNPCEVELKIELEPETVAKAIDSAYRDFSEVTNVPGFRKGKAPRAMLERFVDAERVRRHAAEEMIAPAYREALVQEKLEPYADPEVEIEQYEDGKPFIFKASVPLPPKVELGEYKGIEAKRVVAEVTDEDVEKEIKALQEAHATSTVVKDRPVQEGDILVAEVASAPEGEERPELRRSILQLNGNVPELDANLVGMEPEQTKTFTVEYPGDFSDKELAGKRMEFEVKVLSIRERHLPELDDELAKKAGGFEGMVEMRVELKNRMIRAAEEEADRAVERQIIDEAVSRSTVCFPDVLVEHEAGHDIRSFQERLSRMGMSLEQYIERSGKTQEEFLDELKAAAAERVKTGLVLGEIVAQEKLNVSAEDVEAEIDRLAAESEASRESVESFLETRGGRGQLQSNMLNRKMADFLKSVSKIS